MANKETAQQVMNHPAVMEIMTALSENSKELKKCLNKLALNKGGLQGLISKYSPSQNATDKFVNELKDGTMLPDLLKSETGFLTNSHFYFLPKGKKSSGSFGKDVEVNNAYVSFVKHLKKAANTENPGLAPQETGMALHFLQDMTIPMHTRRQSFFGKIIDFFMHKNFESGKRHGIYAKQEELAQNYKPNYRKLQESLPEGYSANDLFLSNVKFSSNPELQVKRSNKKDWSQIQQEIFNRAVDSTVLALKNISNTI